MARTGADQREETAQAADLASASRESTTSGLCHKCNDTGSPFRRSPWMTAKLCDCEAGQRLASWAALTPAEQAERAIHEGDAKRTAARAARLTRKGC